jgi:hypothetical protein
MSELNPFMYDKSSDNDALGGIILAFIYTGALFFITAFLVHTFQSFQSPSKGFEFAIHYNDVWFKDMQIGFDSAQTWCEFSGGKFIVDMCDGSHAICEIRVQPTTTTTWKKPTQKDFNVTLNNDVNHITWAAV